MELNKAPGRLNIAQRLVELENTYQLHSSVQTFGHQAVSYANQQAAVVLEMSRYEEDSEEYQRYSVLEESSRISVKAELDDARWKLRALGPVNGEYLNQYMKAEASGTHMTTLLALAAQHPSRTDVTWHEWLAEYAAPEQLLSFLQFHNHSIEQQQTDPAISEVVARHKQEFAAAVQDLHREGILIQSAADVQAITLKIGDIFTMIMKEQAGFYEPGIKVINLQQAFVTGSLGRFEELTASIEYAMTHELVHATLGEAYKRYDNQLAVRWIDEALTEILAGTIDRKRTANFETSNRPYVPERRLLQGLLSCAEDSAGLYLAVRAFNGTEKELDAFTTYLDEIWGTVDALGKINSAVKKQEMVHMNNRGQLDRQGEVDALAAVVRQLEDNPNALFDSYASIAR